jgi:Glycosyl transferase family 2/Glycosyl transferases group 1
MRELVFVLAPRQNAFFTELAAVLRGELWELGVNATLVEGWPAPESGRAYALVAPHEHSILAGSAGLPAAALPRTVCVCTEQPETSWFEETAHLAARCGAVFDINLRGAELLRTRGVRAEHLQLGYSPLWDRFSPHADRDLDVVFLGGATPRRELLLASCAQLLTRHSSRIVLADNSRTNPSSAPSFAAGADKLELLARSRVLLNFHRDRVPYFEWVRVLEAIHCGAAVVSEWSFHYEPLVPGEHFLSARPEAAADVAETLLDDEDGRQRMAMEAHRFIRERLPLRHSAERLAEAAERVARRPTRRRGRFLALQPEPRLRDVVAGFRAPAHKAPDLRRTVKNARLEVVYLNRRLESLSAQALRGGEPPPDLEELGSTPAYEGAAPRVSVICALYNHADHIGRALDSVRAQSYGEWELVVIDDGSSDGSAEAVKRFMAAHPDAPTLLARHPVNRGLPAARNAAAARARGEYVLVLDSDNELYPHCLERLVEALGEAPEAAFAYGILEQFDRTGPVGLSGYFGWEPERLVEDNYIDALALIRRATLEELGGYTEDRRLYGWEDYDLWCRIADRGGEAAHVPEIVARYRLAVGSMISLTNLSTLEAREALAEHCPRLFEGVDVVELDRHRSSVGSVGAGRERMAGLR